MVEFSSQPTSIDDQMSVSGSKFSIRMNQNQSGYKNNKFGAFTMGVPKAWNNENH